MKRKFFALILALMILSGCKNASSADLSVADQALLEQMVGLEAYDKMNNKQKEQLLQDLGLSQEAPRYTLTDVEQQGRFVVVLTDTPGLNTFTLHYEDGTLIQVATSFRKTAADTPTVTYFSGDRLADYHYKSIHFLSYAPVTLADLLSAEGFAQVAVTPAN